MCRSGIGVELGARIWPEHIHSVLAQKHGNALRSGNAGVTIALKSSQLRCRKSWQHQDFRCYFLSLPPIFFHFQGVPARLHHGEDSLLVRLAGFLLIAILTDEELREINSQKSRTQH